MPEPSLQAPGSPAARSPLTVSSKNVPGAARTSSSVARVTALGRIDAGRQIIERNVERVAAHLVGIVRIVDQRLRVGTQEGWLAGVLPWQPGTQRADGMAQMQRAGGAVARQHDGQRGGVCLELGHGQALRRKPPRRARHGFAQACAGRLHRCFGLPTRPAADLRAGRGACPAALARSGVRGQAVSAAGRGGIRSAGRRAPPQRETEPRRSRARCPPRQAPPRPAHGRAKKHRLRRRRLEAGQKAGPARRTPRRASPRRSRPAYSGRPLRRRARPSGFDSRRLSGSNDSGKSW